ncbi:MAG: AAA family ATPase [Bacteroidales bacterium]|nr:AAA family ATPase [Bacteroidales bacterium]
MTLTPSQQSALAEFEAFVNSDENNVFLLKGSAGTGKTTLMKAMIDSLDGNKKCVLMAPTGRAAFILGNKTGHLASTIHRAIYTIESGLTNDGYGKMIYALRDNEDPLLNTIYFVDEASMISDAYSENEIFMFGTGYLLEDLFTYCGSRKIVFVGDYAQLPPVGQSFSPALDPEYLRKNFNASCKEFMLREVVRQVADSSIYKNAVTIRDSIEAKLYNEFSISDGDDVQKCESLISAYDNTNAGSIDNDSIIIAFSNQQVLGYNLRIRELLYKDNKERLLPGDLLVISQNNYSNYIELFNGTIVRVLDCDKDSDLEKRIVRFRSSDKDEDGYSITKEIELSFRRTLIETPDHNQVDLLILDNFLTEQQGVVPKDYRQALMADFDKRMSNQQVRLKSNEYYDLMKTDKYLNALICKYGYAITCHKAQGGEWDKVFVDMDKLGGKSNSDYFRWAYTAITRSKKQFWHFASPSFNAVSKMHVLPINNTNKIAYYVPTGENFLDWHYHKLSEICEAHCLSCTENRSILYQHILTIKKDDKYCIIKQVYGKDGYTSNRNVTDTNDKEFSSFAEKVFETSLLPTELPFEAKTDFATKLHDLVVDAVSDLGLSIINVRQEQWKDIYYIKTTPYESMLTFSYNSKGMYSSLNPQSTGGANDILLKALCAKFQ